MKNQRIQKLVKLAYIADIHGDYKIADKIFEKLAQTKLPPRFTEVEIPQLRGKAIPFDRLADYLTGLSAQIEPLLFQRSKLYEIIDKYKPLLDKVINFDYPESMTGSAPSIPAKKLSAFTDSDFDILIPHYSTVETDISRLRMELDNELKKTTKDDNKISVIRKQLEAHEKYLESSGLREILGVDPHNPINVKPYSVLIKELEALEKTIDSKLPDPSYIPQSLDELAKLRAQGKVDFEKERAAFGRLVAFFQKIKTDKADRLLDGIKIAEENKDKGWWRNFFAKSGYYASIITVRPLKNFINGFIEIGAERKSIKNFNAPIIEATINGKKVKKKLTPEAIQAYYRVNSEAAWTEYQQSFGKLIEALDAELVNNYIKIKNEYLPKRGNTNPLTREEILQLVEKSSEVTRNGPLGALITSLFDAFKGRFATLQEAAEARLKRNGIQNPSEIDILAEMIKFDGKFMTKTGISQDLAYRIIRKKGNVSIQDLLESKGNPIIPNITNEKRNLALWIFGSATAIGATTYYFIIKKAREQEAYEKAVRGPGVEVPTDPKKRVKQVEQDVDAILKGSGN